ncbi:MAG: hypothetical protein BroJett011_14410 [Chloroflexota bacterium]|nr:MAG: hypothetical protein BroJett011_14410 [Chloroflexota bacterium]
MPQMIAEAVLEGLKAGLFKIVDNRVLIADVDDNPSPSMADLLARFLGRIINRPIRSLDDDMIDVLAKHYPISPDDIRQSFDLVKSWDATICLCEFSQAYGYSSPYHCIGIFFESSDGILFRKAWAKMAAPSHQQEKINE